MSCYFHHLKELLGEAGIEVSPGNRKQIDQAIHRIVGVDYKNCPEAWKRLKQGLTGEKERRDFITKLKEAAL